MAQDPNPELPLLEGTNGLPPGQEVRMWRPILRCREATTLEASGKAVEEVEGPREGVLRVLVEAGR
jgi:hypothetical protein